MPVYRWVLMMVLACMASSAVCLAGPSAPEPRQVPDNQRIIVRLGYGKLAFVRLPEAVESVDTILPAERLMVGENSPYVSLGLVDPTLTDGRLGIYGVSGRLYIVFFEQVADKSDIEVAITRPTATPKVVQPFTASSLVRALRPDAHGALHMTIPGAQATAPLLPGVFDGRVEFHDAVQLAVGSLLGLRVTVKSLEEVPLKLDIRVNDPLSASTDPAIVALAQWAWPPKYDVDLVAVETHILPPHGQTYLYIIYKERQS